jgi:hypothetical protein
MNTCSVKYAKTAKNDGTSGKFVYSGTFSLLLNGLTVLALLVALGFSLR